MEYIVHKRFKGNTLSGYKNIPALSICEAKNGIIFYDEKPICVEKSENGHTFFARNDDGLGLERGKLISKIKQILNNSKNKKKWEKIWEDKKCQQYKRKDSEYWLWNHNFYMADINELSYILNLIE